MKTPTRFLPRWLGRIVALAALAWAAAVSAQPVITAQPVGTNALAGSVATFTVAANNALTYRWQRAGTNIFNGDFGGRVSGATNPTVVISNLNATDAGSYRVIVSNVSGAVTSAPAALTVLFPPSFTAQPASLTVTQGNNFSLTAAASGPAPLVYQWRKFGVNLTNSAHVGGATSNVLSIFSATTNDASTYRLIVSNNYGAVTSSAATVTVLVPPSVTLAPASQTVTAGLNATFTAAAEGDAPLTYQWLFNGAAISGATNASLALFDLTNSHAGNYQFVAANDVCSVTSAPAVLTLAAPVCVDAPAGLVAWWRAENNGADVTGRHPGNFPYGMSYPSGKVGAAFDFTPGFVFPANYQRLSVPDSPDFYLTNALTLAAWVFPRSYNGMIFFRGDDRPGLDAFTMDAYSAGSVKMFISDGTNSATVFAPLALNRWQYVVTTWERVSGNLKLYVDGQFAAQVNTTIIPIAALDANQYPGIGIGNHGGLSVQFPFDGHVDEPQIYSRALTPTEISASYQASSAGHCTALPVVTQAPSGLTVNQGQSAAFTVAAGGTAPLAFQWLSNGVVFSDSARVTGSTTSNLNFNPALHFDSANYSCRVSNFFGSVTSAGAVLTVVPPPCAPTGVGLVGWWQATGNFLDLAGTNHGAVQAGAVTFTNGVVGSAFYFDGSANNRLLVPDAPELNFGSNQNFSIEAWVRPEIAATAFGIQDIVDKRYENTLGNGSPGYAMDLGDGRIAFRCQQMSFFGAGPDIRDGNYHHLVVSVTRASTNGGLLAVDGQVVMTFDTIGLTGGVSNNAPLRFGNHPLTSLNAGFKGGMDEVMLYARALTPAEITADFHADYIGHCPLPPTVTVAPANLTVVQGGNATFTATLGGSSPFALQWLKNNSPLANATNIFLTLDSVTTNASGNYQVVVVNAGGSVTSSVVPLTVVQPPFVITPPVAFTNIEGQGATITVTVGGTAPLAYQWLSNGLPLADSARITGSATSNLVFTATLRADAADYSCVVTNNYGSVTSAAAALTVLYPPSVTVAPASQTILSGNPATFTATAAGSAPLTFQWLKNNFPITDATNNPLTLASVTTNEAADYQVIVANAAGSVTSSVVTLAVVEAPFIVTPPLAQTVAENQFISLAVTAGGTAPLAYQWLSNGVPIADLPGISGSTTRQLSFSSVQRAFAADYACVVTNAYGSVTSAPATLTVLFLPVFVTSPASSTNDPGSDLTLSSTLNGSFPIDYQWQFNGSPVGAPGQLTNNLAATATLTLTNLNTNQSGAYTLVASNSVGVVTSAVANVTVQFTPPTFTLQPTNRTLAVSNQLQLITLATGSAPIAYQWFASGVAFTNDDRTLGADTATLTLTNALLTDSGNYFVVASNLVGMTTSAVAVVSVQTPPSITVPLTNQTGIVTSNILFSVVADGTGPFAYRWFRNGVVLTNGARYSGATTDTLTLSNLAVADAGSFWCRVTNAVGQVISSPAALTVMTPPVFTNQPVSRTVVPGQSVTFTATATNAFPIAYQWQFNNAIISGATNTSFTIAAVTTNDFGNYRLVASNAAGATVSADATLMRSQLVAWGNNAGGVTNIPAGLTNVIAVACGDDGSSPVGNGGISHNLALRADGTVFAWGSNIYGETNVPANATNVVAIAASRTQNLALRADGTVVAWGATVDALNNFPTGLSNVVALAAGAFQGMALRADGKVFVWGYNSTSAQNSVPPNLGRAVGLGAGSAHSLALRADGQVFAWGNTNGAGKTGGGPAAWLPGLTDFTSVAGGLYHSVGIRSNGVVAVWPSASNLVSVIPPSATNVTQVAAGDYFNLALRVDGKIFAWGTNTLGIINVPAYATNVIAIAAGQSHALALLSDGRPLITRPPIGGTSWTGRSYTFTASVTGDAPLALQWQFNGTNLLDATNATLTLPSLTTNDAGGYRLVASNALGVATSIAAPLTVNVANAPAFYSALPSAWTNYVGGKLWLNGAAIGSGPLTWQWKFNGTNLIGATNEDLIIEPLVVANDGSYNVVVSNMVTHLAVTNSSTPTAGGVSSAQRVALVRTWGYLATEAPMGTTNGITNAVAIAAGYGGSGTSYGYNWALRSDGKLAGWGSTVLGNEGALYGSNYASSTFTALAMGYLHTVALRSDGTVVDWGNGSGGTGYNPNVVPGNVTGVTAIGAGDNTAMAVRGDGSVVAWGNFSSQPINYITNVPASASNVVSVVGGPQHCLALRTDGRVVGWGSSSYNDITNVPANITNIIALAPCAGMSTYIVGLAVRADGTVAIWGNSASRYTIPADWTNIVSLAASYQHITALRSDGTVAQTGIYNNQSSAMVPAYTENVIAIAVGGDHDVALFGPRTPAIAVQPWSRAVYRGTNTTFHCRTVSPLPASFQWLFNGVPIVGATNWSLTLNNAQFTNNGAYQLVVSNRYGVTTSKAAKLTVTLPLPDALDTATGPKGESAYNWTTTGGAQWFGQGTTTHDGVDAAQAGNIGNATETILQTIVTNTGPTAGTVSFWWKVFSEAGFDTLEFRNNGNLLATISGEIGWEQRTFTASPGTNVLQWRYSKDSSNTGGADTAWVDEFVFTPGPPVILSVTPPRTVTVPSNFTFTVSASGVAPLSYRWLKDGTNLVGTSSTLRFNPVTRTNTGSYTCIVSNTGGFASSNTALTVIAPQLLGAPTLQPDGVLQFTSADLDGGPLTAADLARMELQASDTLTNWTTVMNALSLTNGVLQFRDLEQANFPARYYRIVEH